jgi:RND family efflux transporter MFP subunit
MRRLKSTTAIILTAAGVAGCNRNEGAPAGGGFAFPPAVVQLAAATPSAIADSTEYVATLKSLRSTAIQPQIDGQITQIFVTSGDRVPEGARLMQIDPRRQEAAVSSQEAERAAREANVAFARQQQDRARDLFAAGAISKQELEQAETALRTAEANLQALQAQVQQQQVQLRYYTVAAPTSGIIGDVPVRVGNQVTPQTILTTIDQNDILEVYVQVPVERAGELRNGLPIQILSSDGSQTLTTTTVNFVSPHVDDQTQSVLVKGTVRNPAGTLRSSQYVRARLVWRTTEGLVVPVTAVTRINGQYFAFVAEEAKGPDGKAGLVAKQRSIKVGPIAGDSYPVLEGIKPGEQLVVSGVQKLVDGAPIAPAAGAGAPAATPGSQPPASSS